MFLNNIGGTMFKKRLFIILLSLLAILIFATAATCNMCGVEVTDEGSGDQGSLQGDNTATGSSSGNNQGSQGNNNGNNDNNQGSQESTNNNNAGNGNNNQDPGNSNNGDSQQGNDSKNDQQDNNIEITGIVVGDVVDEHVEPAPFLYTDSTYTCYPVLAIPPDGTETYNWSVSGGSSDNGAFYMQWNTPSDEAFYTITINIHRGDSWGFYNEDFYIEPETAMGPPLEGPQITGVEVINAENNTMDLNTEYNIAPIYTDPNNMIRSFHYEVSQGTDIGVWDEKLYYRSPDFETDVNITIIAIDDNLDEMIRETFTIYARDLDIQ